MTERHFRVVQLDGKKVEIGGVSIKSSGSPGGAARKLLTSIAHHKGLKKNKKASMGKVKFCIQEYTQGSSKKMYGPYVGHYHKYSAAELKKAMTADGKVKFTMKPVVKLVKGKNMKGGNVGPQEPQKPHAFSPLDAGKVYGVKKAIASGQYPGGTYYIVLDTPTIDTVRIRALNSMVNIRPKTVNKTSFYENTRNGIKQAAPKQGDVFLHENLNSYTSTFTKTFSGTQRAERYIKNNNLTYIYETSTEKAPTGDFNISKSLVYNKIRGQVASIENAAMGINKKQNILSIDAKWNDNTYNQNLNLKEKYVFVTGESSPNNNTKYINIKNALDINFYFYNKSGMNNRKGQSLSYISFLNSSNDLTLENVIKVYQPLYKMYILLNKANIPKIFVFVGYYRYEYNLLPVIVTEIGEFKFVNLPQEPQASAFDTYLLPIDNNKIIYDSGQFISTKAGNYYKNLNTQIPGLMPFRDDSFFSGVGSYLESSGQGIVNSTGKGVQNWRFGGPQQTQGGKKNKKASKKSVHKKPVKKVSTKKK